MLCKIVFPKRKRSLTKLPRTNVSPPNSPRITLPCSCSGYTTLRGIPVAAARSSSGRLLFSGFAANNFNHGINRDSINQMSVSVLIREVTPTAIAEMNIRKLDTTKNNLTTKNPRNPSRSESHSSTDGRRKSRKSTSESQDAQFPPVVQVFGNVALV